MNPLIIALDFPTIAAARSLAADLVDEVGGFKIGLELIMSQGPSAIDEIANLGLPVFADVKLHDIPNTVGRAVAAIGRRGARWITVHASGGRAMIEAAVQGVSGTALGVLAVTTLTSLSADDLRAAGVDGGVDEQVRRLTQLADESGAEGVVCSPQETTIARACASRLSLFVPGIRPSGADGDDQKRFATPEEAIRGGADYLVVGRPVTGAKDPLSTVRSILAEIANIAS